MKQVETLRSLVDSLEDYGDRPAIVALDNKASQWSYRELADHVKRLASGLRGAGMDTEERALLLAGNRPEWIIVALAVIAAGATVTPADVQTGDETLRHILNDSGARWILTTADQVERLDDLELADSARLVLLDVEAEDERDWRQLLASDVDALPESEAGETTTLFYTSGTTGRPKGVPLSHANLTFQINSVVKADIVTGQDRLLLPLPLHHVYPFVMGMLAPLALGLPIILPQALTGPEMVRALHEGEVTLVIGVPRLYAALFEGIQERIEARGRMTALLFRIAFGASMRLRRHLALRAGKFLLRPVHQQFGPHLRTLASGGSALDPELAWNLEAMGFQVGTGYGLTETSPLLTLNPPGKARIGSAGRPIDGVEIRIDPSAYPDDGQSAENGATTAASNTEKPHGGTDEGEILARGPNVFSGYHNLPEKTEETFTDDWFRTGDLGYFDEDGYLYITGRVSTTIVTPSGENIQPQDVEEVYSGHPLISESGILQDEGQLVAVIVPELNELREREGEIEEALDQAVAEQSRQLPSHQQIADYALTRRPLERTRLGKIRRHLLAERYEKAQQEDLSTDEAEGDAISLDEMSEEDRALLRDPAAQETWEWLVERVRSQQVDVRLTPDSSLQYDLGIDSLEWVNLTLQISQHTGVELSEDIIARIETVRDLLEEIRAAAQKEIDTASVLEEPEAWLDERQQRRLEPIGASLALLARGMYALDRIVIHGLLRLQVNGLDNLPDEPPYILAPNHISFLDAPTIAATLPYSRLRQLYWAGSTDVMFQNPMMRIIGRLAQTVPVGAERSAVLSSLAFAAAVLKRNRALVWFPEGGISDTGELQTFQPGIGLLLAHFQTPVVPVLLTGTREVLPPATSKPRRIFHRVTLTFGRPLGPDELERTGEGDEPHDRIVQGLHAHMLEMANDA